MSGSDAQGDRRIKVAVSGARGRMGSMTCAAIQAEGDLLLVAEIDPAFSVQELTDSDRRHCFAGLEEAIAAVRPDVVVDFTTPAVVRDNVLGCVRLRVPVVVGTTGLSAGDLAEIEREVEARDIPVLVAPNFAMGAVLMMQFARQAAEHFRACEIVELHHEAKLDAPSGTSRLTRLRVEETWREAGFDKEIPIHSVRLPGLVAHQEVIFGGLGETLTIRHDSLSRESFMPGVVLAVRRISGLQGLVVGLENIL
ncbi:MAG: 4-hydroxy-tetrahydrodipicolinate reductase [Actinobacteria bacterium RBG_16_64_13]|nr:MAG: 4-hydroxy-tetrahydrodipicolinate reductase [Actinobacteria bacterium RBG_16_64_13]